MHKIVELILHQLKAKSEIDKLIGEHGGSWVFAHVVVPGIVCSILALSLFGSRPYLAAGEQLAVVPLESAIHPQEQTRSVDGLAVLLENQMYDLSINWDPAPKAEIWTSLSEEAVNLNRFRLQLDEAGAQFRMPLSPGPGLVMLVTSGTSSETILLNGREVHRSELRMVSRKSAAVATSTFGAAMFSFGLVLTRIRAPRASQPVS